MNSSFADTDWSAHHNGRAARPPFGNARVPRDPGYASCVERSDFRFFERLRVRWADLHSDEVFFRDTAHGFLAWAVSTLFVFGLLALGASAGNSDRQDNGPDVGYYASSLYRGATAAVGDVTPETAAILASDSASGNFPADDRAYLARQVAARTGVSQAEAESRVNATIDRINADRQKIAQAAETARKAAVGFSVTLFISLLVGAFIASVSAALGGRLRDQY